MLELADYQLDAMDRIKNGSILCGDVGSGKSRTALAYYYIKECGGECKINGKGHNKPMANPKDLYIITTAKKRDSLDWIEESAPFLIDYNAKLTIDSWNNIKKYDKVYNAFFIFDEQRVVGSGSWVKAFLNIARKNRWILLSATPGDKWIDYVPVFIANGFYRNKTEFCNRHVVYKRFAKYPQIERYIDQGILIKHRNNILIKMKDQRKTVRHNIKVSVNYDKDLYKTVWRDRWDPYEKEPIKETGKLLYLLRKVVNSDQSRLDKLSEILTEKNKVIVFYNYEFEVDLIKNKLKVLGWNYAEWNGQKHEEISGLLNEDRWAYLVQYTAGCEGWNCIHTDTIVFYSQSYSYRQTEQACGRIDRMNTPYHDLYYYFFRSSSPIDNAIHKALVNKRNFNKNDILS